MTMNITSMLTLGECIITIITDYYIIITILLLLFLLTGNCMSALAENRKHIPYRDSKLTRSYLS